MKKIVLFMLMCLLPVLAVMQSVQAAQAIQVNGIRTWPAPDHTRVVFDLSAPVDYKLFSLENPMRLVIDIKNTHFNKSVVKSTSKDRFLRRIRSAMRKDKDLRVVFDLHDSSKFKSFLLKPYKQYGHRLVIDLYPKKKRNKTIISKTVPKAKGLRDLVVAIDAGHGGEDPGAQGRDGTYEKDVVLAIASKLAEKINKERGMRAVMIRSGDYFLSLRQRTVRARKHKADLFISIHADAFDDRRVHGASVYILSKNGASDEAGRWLAEKENASDLIGGVSLDDKEDLLASVLLDLSQTATIEASYKVADKVLAALKPLGKLHKKEVQQARFVVLKSPDIPSMLIESAFISNPKEERRLLSSHHQKAFAGAVLKGLRGYFTEHAPPGTLYATRKHVITRGDTLSDIAHQYRVSLARLRNVNKLRGDTVRIGQVIRIPFSSDS